MNGSKLKLFKRITSLMICLVLVFGYMPMNIMTVQAEESHRPGEDNKCANCGEDLAALLYYTADPDNSGEPVEFHYYHISFIDAINASNNASSSDMAPEVQLLNNYTYDGTEGIEYNNSNNSCLRLEGYTLDLGSSYMYGNTDWDIKGTGMIKTSNSSVAAIKNDSSVTVTGASIINESGDAVECHNIDLHGVSDPVTIEAANYGIKADGEINLWGDNFIINSGEEYADFYLGDGALIIINEALENSNFTVHMSNPGVFAKCGNTESSFTLEPDWFTSAVEGYRVILNEADNTLSLVRDISSDTDDNISATVDDSDFYYTGSTVELADDDLTITVDGTILVKDTDYEIKSYSNNIAATTDTSKATVTIAGVGDYTGERTIEYDIQKDIIRIKEYSDEEVTPVKTYDGTTMGPDITGLVLEAAYSSAIKPEFTEGTDYTAGWEYSDSDVGADKELKISIKLSDELANNYELVDDKTITGTITQAPLTLTADDRSVYVGNTVPDTADLTYTAEGLVNDELLDEVLTAKPVLSYSETPDMTIEGTYDIKISGAAAKNYNITYVSGSLTVSPKLDISGDITLEAKDISYSQEVDVFAKIDGGADIDLEYTYSADDGATFVELSSLMDINSYLPVGDYIVKVSYEDDYQSGEKTAAFEVTKATPVVDTAPEVEQLVYNPNKTLADLELTEGKAVNKTGTALTGTWTWENSDEVPKVENTGYKAIFIPDDSDNYNTVTTIIPVEVSKATPYIATEPTVGSLTYGELLRLATLSKGGAQYSVDDTTKVVGRFSWETPDALPAVADSDVTTYKVVFTPSDTKNYNIVPMNKTVTVSKALDVPNAPESELKVPFENDSLFDVELPEGWQWKADTEDTGLVTGVSVKATAEYVAYDKDNFINTTANITVTRLEDPWKEASIVYSTHVQRDGWQNFVTNGAMSGTSGESKRLEGIVISVDTDADLGVQYTTHCQTYGWLPWTSDGAVSGTTGESKRLEAIMIQLTGKDASDYDIYYRVHAQSYGWLNWAKNGEPAGTAGYSKRLEGIQIVVVKKGESINENMSGIASVSSKAYIAKAGKSPVYNGTTTDNLNPVVGGASIPNVTYRTHVQTYGWQNWKYNGAVSGTSGESKRLEGIEINISNTSYSGDVIYTTHAQSYGWQSNTHDKSTWFRSGETAGTYSESKRLEAICIDLTGELKENYDIYYRVHIQSYGWLDWACNGAPAGSTGHSKRLEGIQIVIVPKDSGKPSATYGGVTSVSKTAYIDN